MADKVLDFPSDEHHPQPFMVRVATLIQTSDPVTFLARAREHKHHAVKLSEEQHAKLIELIAKDIGQDVEQLKRSHPEAGGTNSLIGKNGNIRMVFCTDWKKKPVVYHDGTRATQTMISNAIKFAQPALGEGRS